MSICGIGLRASGGTTGERCYYTTQCIYGYCERCTNGIGADWGSVYWQERRIYGMIMSICGIGFWCTANVTRCMRPNSDVRVCGSQNMTGERASGRTTGERASGAMLPVQDEWRT